VGGRVERGKEQAERKRIEAARKHKHCRNPESFQICFIDIDVYGIIYSIISA
jgi:hypothetical protein